MPASRDPIGSLAWARRTGGRLSAVERFAVARSAVAELLKEEGSRALRRLGLGTRHQIDLALAEIPLPASPASRAAEDLCAEVSSPALAGHCHRTYLWGSLLAARDGISFETELLHAASLLHDLGLTDRFRPRGEVHCFALAGAEEAECFGLRQGWPSPRAEALAEAICRHLNPRVDAASGAEAHLVRQGSGLDVAGLRLGEIAPATRAAVLERHPRLGFKAELGRLFEAEVEARPRSRIAALHKLGFGRRIVAAPFAD
jgi:hypothetical protein